MKQTHASMHAAWCNYRKRKSVIDADTVIPDLLYCDFSGKKPRATSMRVKSIRRGNTVKFYGNYDTDRVLLETKVSNVLIETRGVVVSSRRSNFEDYRFAA